MEEDKVQLMRRQKEEEATEQRAGILGLTYLDTREFENIFPLARDLFTNEQMYRAFLAPLQIGDIDTNKPWRILITSQTPRSVIQKLSKKYQEEGKTLELFLISESAWKNIMRRYDPPKKIIYDDIEIAGEGDSTTLDKVSQTLANVASDQVFDYLIDQADRLGASDIHIENQRQTIRIRMRVDGALHPVAELGRDRYRVIMGELSSRAGVSSASKTSQSGHMQKDIYRDGTSHLLNLRVETVPTMYGMDAVMRLFNFDESMLQLDLLGIAPKERAEIDEIISHPRGMVLMVGPTGSGKSTTLYSMLNALNTLDRKIITLEDPIEYGIGGISQIPIDTTHGASFADGLRSVLRLDPDVVMVGEIRDNDTARTAIQASITGHLVLSSFHANSTSAAFSRMIDMIGLNPIFSTAIRLLIAQRLVRKLDKNAKEYIPDEATKNWVRSVLDGVPAEKIPQDISGDFKLWKPMPSEESPFGYKGRIVVMEMMVVNDNIAAFLRGERGMISTEAIEAQAREDGLLTLMQQGVISALRGDTTIEEVNRVI
ncbi:MAG: Flp pilus assembly complex ATPase component TadA [Candidatus Nanogingivalaceae bacterium]|jgi:general secretory pathway component, cryptic|nr:MAG: Flp pilus assembly complex ATPase component TadA [Candidatus Nanogingivalaceae bacterium]QWB91396.2 MAG: Flp pilus assembly complex ATPase component TadA [Candidatus Nanogingivalaceae bacterium]